MKVIFDGTHVKVSFNGMREHHLFVKTRYAQHDMMMIMPLIEAPATPNRDETRIRIEFKFQELVCWKNRIVS